MLPLIYPLLTASPDVTAIIGDAPDTRAYRHGQAPEGTPAPYVTWSAPGGAPDSTFDGPDADMWRVHVDCWSDDDTEIELLALAVRNALEPHAYLVAFLADEQDPVTKRFRISFAFDFIKPL